MEETSGLIDATNWYGNNGGIGAPPSTPVEYFMDAYGTGNTDIQGEEASWLEYMDDLTTNTMEAETGGGIEKRKKTTRGQKKSKPYKTGGARVTKVPREKRVFRTCARCGRKNHNRRLFCAGCYGGKDVMKGVSETK